MSTRRGISILAVLVALAMALAAAPTWASKVAAPGHAGYRTPVPTTTGGNTKPPPSGQGQGPITGGGGMAPRAGTQPVVASAPARAGQGSVSGSTKGLPSMLPATGGAARGGR